ncbi:MAG: hypothetical protein DRH24_19775 [Deltaproteobacteria bacterium]|nr:MAG: hypothetical protein DRH24_19775 [Deltaproteobacteria bacterium]
MPRITPLHWKTLECIFLKDGFVYERTRGDHNCYSKSGCSRPVVIPKYSEVGVFIIQNNIKSANMSRERFFELLNKC